jgi:hypothetical protein
MDGYNVDMRIIITGDRNWYDPDLADQIVARLIARYGPGIVIVHGAAAGIESSLAEAADEIGVEHEPHPAHWNDLGRRAGPVRNAEMIAAGAEMCLPFHRAISTSKGTKDCARRAIEAGIPTYLIDSERAEPMRLRAGDARLK